jgi:hypothetical protein
MEEDATPWIPSEQPIAVSDGGQPVLLDHVDSREEDELVGLEQQPWEGVGGWQ